VSVAKAAKEHPRVPWVDWENIPLADARILYGQLKAEFDKAGTILNARAMPAQNERYVCFICPCTCAKKSTSVYAEDHEEDCKKIHPGEARGKDDAYRDPKTGLYVPIRICGERHWIEYQNMRIQERYQRNAREGTL
jgi:hypothetical protein